MTAFVNKPISTKYTPVAIISRVIVTGRRICGTKSRARTMGPATSCGKKET